MVKRKYKRAKRDPIAILMYAVLSWYITLNVTVPDPINLLKPIFDFVQTTLEGNPFRLGIELGIFFFQILPAVKLIDELDLTIKSINRLFYSIENIYNQFIRKLR